MEEGAPPQRRVRAMNKAVGSPFTKDNDNNVTRFVGEDSGLLERGRRRSTASRLETKGTSNRSPGRVRGQSKLMTVVNNQIEATTPSPKKATTRTRSRTPQRKRSESPVKSSITSSNDPLPVNEETIGSVLPSTSQSESQSVSEPCCTCDWESCLKSVKISDVIPIVLVCWFLLREWARYNWAPFYEKSQ